MKKALIVVDVQNDFLPGGSLAVENGDKIIPIINNLLTKFDTVIFTMDWHTPDNIGFASRYKMQPYSKIEIDGVIDTLWPDHCVQNTQGAKISDEIKFEKINGAYYIVKKGYRKDEHPYSGFDQYTDTNEGELDMLLQHLQIDEVYVTGLALDFCVKSTAIDAAKASYKTNLIIDATAPVFKDVSQVMKEIEEMGIRVIQSNEL